MHVRPVPKVSIFMALTTKIVTEKAKKWPKMARFWPKSRYNGRVMAREVFFYQCLWVTKFCAKFGCSRTPRTASVPNSFIVLRCMWKVPAPLIFLHFSINFVLTEVILNYKGAGSFHTHRKTMKELGALAVLGIRERPNLAENLVTHRHW